MDAGWCGCAALSPASQNSGSDLIDPPDGSPARALTTRSGRAMARGGRAHPSRERSLLARSLQPVHHLEWGVRAGARCRAGNAGGWAIFEKWLREITDHRDILGDRAAHVEHRGTAAAHRSIIRWNSDSTFCLSGHLFRIRS
jgi:hypothetical protein